MSSNFEANWCGFATWCSKFHFSSVACHKPKKVGKHWSTERAEKANKLKTKMNINKLQQLKTGE